MFSVFHAIASAYSGILLFQALMVCSQFTVSVYNEDIAYFSDTEPHLGMLAV